MKIIAVANQKGGVAKTSTVACLAAALSQMGKRVLAIDCDPQGNLSMAMGVLPNPEHPTTYDLLLDPRTAVEHCAIYAPWGDVQVISTEVSLAAAEVELANEENRNFRLAAKLRKKLPYDYVFIDTPPSLGFLTLNALAAASDVFIPVQVAYLAIHGLKALLETVDAVREHGNERLKILGLLLTMYDGRTRHTQQVEELLRESFGDLVFATVIRRTVAFDYATVAGVPLVLHSPESPGAEAYMTIAQEVLKRA